MRIVLTLALIVCGSLFSNTTANAADPTTDFIFPCNTGTYTVRYLGTFGPTETPTTGGNLTSGGGCSGEFSLDTSVTSIAYIAFWTNTTITKVIFPEGLKSIGGSAFDSTRIREVILPASLETITSSAYLYVTSVETFTTYSSTTLPDGFLADNSLRSVSIFANIESISNFAFARNIYLAQLTLPNTVISIGANAFTNTALKSITFPASLQSIGANVFLGSPVETFTTNSSMALGSFDFLKGSTLRNVQILGNVETIGSNAFDSATALSTVTLPASLKTIGSEAFKNARSLTSITIPSGLLNIEANSFDIERFTSLTYNGSRPLLRLALKPMQKLQVKRQRLLRLCKIM
ncbi:MAG: leucine-rich repeat domain-containing protein [Actinobacteria bacterium]|nr:leucine-rich repeat domain-containing protein [Actinomycetota bacterium]